MNDQAGQGQCQKKPRCRKELLAIVNLAPCLFCTSLENGCVCVLGCQVAFNSLQPHGRQASLSLTISWSVPKFVFVELVMPYNHLILCRLPLLLPSVFPNIRVFSSESAVRIRWPKDWTFEVSISPSNEYSRLIPFRID